MRILGSLSASPLALAAALGTTVAAAAIADLAARRIPNWITAPGALLALALHSYYGGWRGAALSLEGAALGLAIFLTLYAAGGMGAGDVKLFAAVGAFVGPRSLVLVFVLTGLLGGIAAVCLALARGRLRQTLLQSGHILLSLGSLRWQDVRRSGSLEAPGALRLPYGAVIAGGTLLSLLVEH